MSFSADDKPCTLSQQPAVMFPDVDSLQHALAESVASKESQNNTSTSLRSRPVSKSPLSQQKFLVSLHMFCVFMRNDVTMAVPS